MTPAEDFFKVNPPSRLDFRSLRPPLPREFPESHPSGGCGFFLEQPNHVTFIFINSMSHDLLVQMAYNQSKATRNSIHLMNQSNRSISICLLFLFCLCVFISRSYENHSIVGLKVHCLVKWKKNCFVLKPILCLTKDTTWKWRVFLVEFLWNSFVSLPKKSRRQNFLKFRAHWKFIKYLYYTDVLHIQNNVALQSLFLETA